LLIASDKKKLKDKNNLKGMRKENKEGLSCLVCSAIMKGLWETDGRQKH